MFESIFISLILISAVSSQISKGPFKYFVSKEVGGGGQLLTFAHKVGGWGWPNADVSKKEKKYPTKKSFLCVHRKKN
jgi:hypothetical protein